MVVNLVKVSDSVKRSYSEEQASALLLTADRLDVASDEEKLLGAA